MNEIARQLSERIRNELVTLQDLVAQGLRSWEKADRMPDELAYLDSVALNLHGFYMGLEGDRICVMRGYVIA